VLVALDFDGTLAPIVEDPALARSTPSARAAVAALLDAARVAVISGRPLAYLAAEFPDPRVELAGIYGIQRRREGVCWQHPAAAAWRPAVAETVAAARAALPGVRVESKDGLSCAIHWRETPSRESEARRVAARLARDHDLELVAARSAVELRPPIGAGKAAVLADLARGEDAVVYAGDDAADVEVLDWLARARRTGTFGATLGVAVDSDEMPGALRSAADIVIDGQAGVPELLRDLAAGRVNAR
jgi:trehalose 6-phosphate phosphatase